ncbi:MAG: hypothetical protein LBF67_00970 [Prevotellaceae bacterium]|jgi:hypothetical protein|nr:hypothetical protein [Prevotellaceae bacterium]
MKEPAINKFPTEVFGYPHVGQPEKLRSAIQQQYCRFIKGTCIKPRKSEPHVKVGICSLGHKGGLADTYLPVIICPQRFKEEAMFEVIREKYLSHWVNIEWISEVNIGVGGSVDYVAITKNRKGEIVDFLCVEIQAGGTTGSPYPAVVDLKSKGKYTKESYSYGINWANEFSKTMMQQAYKKGKIISHWKRKIVFVVQDIAISYLKTAADTSHLYVSKPSLPIDFCAFSLKWNRKQWNLAFSNIYSTDVEGINLMLGGAEVDAYPTEQEFIVSIIKKGIQDGVLDRNKYAKFL